MIPKSGVRFSENIMPNGESHDLAVLKRRRTDHSVFGRSMPSDLIPAWMAVRVKKMRQDKTGTSVLIHSEPDMR
jgi:hypothetical protein